MKHIKWQVLLGGLLVLLSAAVYFIHFLVFKDVHHIFIYLLGDIAFVPVEVLLVTIVIHRMLNQREKRAMLEKLNMVIGVFFTEVGSHLISNIFDAVPGVEDIKRKLNLTVDWSEKDFSAASNKIREYDFEIDSNKCNWIQLKGFLLDKRPFMLDLLGNPNLLEHESFTELLRAVFHLTEELVRREDISSLPDSDYEHLANDIKRSFGLLVSEWLLYARHLKSNFPYMYSLVVRTNPFNDEASPIVG